jgi:hypothetical protein
MSGWVVGPRRALSEHWKWGRQDGMAGLPTLMSARLQALKAMKGPPTTELRLKQMQP